MSGRPRHAVLGVRSGEALLAISAQALSSASNFGIQLALALTLTADRFGAMVIGFAVYYFSLALVRALVGDPLVALAEPITADEQSGGWRGDVLWLILRRRILVIAGGSGAVVMGLAVVLGSVRGELAVLAAALPALLLQDGSRSWCWARSQPGLVAVLDGTWVAVSGLLAAALLLGPGLPRAGATALLLAWSAGGAASAGLGWRLRFRSRGALSSAASAAGRRAGGGGLDAAEEATTRSMGTNQALLAADANGLPAAVAAVSSPATSGGMRAAALPFMPVATVIGAFRMLTLPVLQRATTSGHPGKAVAWLTGATAAIVVAQVGVILVVLAAVPAAWLGPSGELIEPWFLAAAIIVAARMVAMPLSDVLSLGVDQRRVLRLRLGTTALDWTATLTAASVGGFPAAMQARTVTAVLTLLVWGAAVVEGVRQPADQLCSGREEESEPYVVA